MALISARTIITSLCLFHITLGFFFLTSPETIAEQSIVFILGEAMGIPYTRSLEARSPALAFLAAVLAIMGVSDIVTLSLPEEIWLMHHWGLQAPLRFSMSLLLATYVYLFGASSPLYASGSFSASSSREYAHTKNPSYAPSTWGGDGLKNRVFFAFMFVETVSWFWIWIMLREEQQEMALRKARRRRPSL